jgi:hypothetical protein
MGMQVRPGRTVDCRLAHPDRRADSREVLQDVRRRQGPQELIGILAPALRADRGMTQVDRAILAAAAAVVAILLSAGTAVADQTPTPYQPGGPDGPIGGISPLPAICATQPLACALHFDPDKGTWVPNR